VPLTGGGLCAFHAITKEKNPKGKEKCKEEFDRAYTSDSSSLCSAFCSDVEPTESAIIPGDSASTFKSLPIDL
jgi:hypothetical protein